MLEISLTKMCYGFTEGRTDVNQYTLTISKRGYNNRQKYRSYVYDTVVLLS